MRLDLAWLTDALVWLITPNGLKAIGLVLAAGSLFYAVSRLTLLEKTARSTFLLQLYQLMETHNDVHAKVTSEGGWSGQSGPVSRRDWIEVGGLLGMFEYIHILVSDKLLNIKTVDRLYSYRLYPLVANQIIFEKHLQEGKGWDGVLELLEKLKKQAVYKGLSSGQIKLPAPARAIRSREERPMQETATTDWKVDETLLQEENGRLVGVGRVAKALQGKGLELGSSILTSKDADVEDLLTELRIEPLPDGFQQCQLPFILRGETMHFLTVCAPNAAFPKHEHRLDDGLRLVVRGSIRLNDIDLKAGDWVYVPRGTRYSFVTGADGCLLYHAYGPPPKGQVGCGSDDGVSASSETGEASSV